MITQSYKKTTWFHLILASVLVLFSLALYHQSQILSGGLDSYEHYLKSRYAIKYPSLFLDQWNKPVFTLFTVIPAQAGISGIVMFNIFCLVGSGLILSNAFAKKGMRMAWLIQIFLFFSPILLEHNISALTEPLNILMLSLLIVCHLNGRTGLASMLAGLLPFVRTEGFVLMGCYVLVLLLEKKHKKLLLLIVGPLLMNLIGFVVTHEPLWIITSNPYFRFEMDGQFDPGSGGWLHFFKLAPKMFNWLLLVLFGLAHWVLFKNWRDGKTNSTLLYCLMAFWGYFMAHVVIYKLGILGSHGLTRPMAVVSPLITVSSFYGFDFLMKYFSLGVKNVLAVLLSLFLAVYAYKVNHFPFPFQMSKLASRWDESQRNFMKAGAWLKQNNLDDRTVIHQSPFYDVMFDKDPYDIKSSYRIWSILQENDWSEYGVILIWDAYYAQREGNLKMEWIRTNKDYRELYHIADPGSEEPGKFDVYIFEKKYK